MNTGNSKKTISAYLFTSLLIFSSNADNAVSTDTSFTSIKNNTYSIKQICNFDTSAKAQVFINRKKSIKSRYKKIAQSESFNMIYKDKSVGDLMLIEE